MCVHCVQAVPMEARREGNQFPGTGATASFELQTGHWDLKQGPLEEKQVFLTQSHLTRPHSVFFWMKIKEIIFLNADTYYLIRLIMHVLYCSESSVSHKLFYGNDMIDCSVSSLYFIIMNFIKHRFCQLLVIIGHKYISLTFCTKSFIYMAKYHCGFVLLSKLRFVLS